jgi:hypothetical protein
MKLEPTTLNVNWGPPWSLLFGEIAAICGVGLGVGGGGLFVDVEAVLPPQEVKRAIVQPTVRKANGAFIVCRLPSR